MVPPSSRFAFRLGLVAAVAGIVFYSHAARAQSVESSGNTRIGRIDFEAADLPPANVELDLSQGTFHNLFGIGDAAVAGIAETLTASASGEHADATRMAAEQLAAVRQIIGLSSNVIHEVRVRTYEKMTDDLASRFDSQLGKGDWEKVAVLRKDNEAARVFVVHQDESIRGVFVVAAGKGGQALVNVVCDISPENVKKLTAAATKIGLDNGLQREIEIKFRKMERPPVAPPQPPSPPEPPRPPEQNS